MRGKTCQNAENKQTFYLTGKIEIDGKTRQNTETENKQTYDLTEKLKLMKKLVKTLKRFREKLVLKNPNFSFSFMDHTIHSEYLSQPPTRDVFSTPLPMPIRRQRNRPRSLSNLPQIPLLPKCMHYTAKIPQLCFGHDPKSLQKCLLESQNVHFGICPNVRVHQFHEFVSPRKLRHDG